MNHAERLASSARFREKLRAFLSAEFAGAQRGDVYNALGISRQDASKWMRSGANPWASTFFRVLDAMGIETVNVKDWT